jgi:copper(I)-binding protein
MTTRDSCNGRQCLRVAAWLVCAALPLAWPPARGRAAEIGSAERVTDVRVTDVRVTDVRVTDVRVTDVRVTDAWIRWLPAGLPGAGYMTLTNLGAVPRLLTGASSPAYDRIEFHRTQTANGLSAMTPVESVTLEPHASLAFAEGGYHLMLIQPTHPLRPGEQVPVLLNFAGGAKLAVAFVVRAGGAAAQ